MHRSEKHPCSITSFALSNTDAGVIMLSWACTGSHAKTLFIPLPLGFNTERNASGSIGPDAARRNVLTYINLIRRL
jgi:hypothetical protein